MRKIQKLSHDEVSKMMLSYIASHLHAANINQKRDTTNCIVDGKKIVLISPVQIKQTPSLERRLEDNSSKDIATGFVFPKSSKYYKGHYLKPLEPVEYSLDGNIRWHHPVNLSVVEAYLLDHFGSELTYFDPLLKSMEIMKLRKIPDFAVAKILELTEFGKVEGDKELWELGRKLKEQYGKRHSFKIYDASNARRYRELSQLEHGKDEIREKFSQNKIGGEFSLDMKKYKGGILIARVVPYYNYYNILKK